MSEDHKLIHADCLDPLRGLATLADKSVDVCLTDPPFASEIYQRCKKNPGRTRASFRGANTVSAGLQALTRGAIGTLDDVLAPAVAHIARITRRWALLFCDVESLHLVRGALVDAGMVWVRTGIWTKPDPMPQFSGDRPSQAFEACAIAHAADTKLRWNGGGMPAIWHYPISKGEERPDHPCPKPIALMQELIMDFSDHGELICDPFAGSGTTLVAAKRLGRKAIGWERDATFWERAVRRLENTKQQYELLPRGPKPKQQKMVLP